MMTEADRREALEHRDALMAIRAILATNEGRVFFKYLLKNLEVGELPPIGLEGSILFDKLGFLRSGHAIWKLVAEANPKIAGEILANIEKEKYEILNLESQAGGS